MVTQLRAGRRRCWLKPRSAEPAWFPLETVTIQEHSVSSMLMHNTQKPTNTPEPSLQGHTLLKNHGCCQAGLTGPQQDPGNQRGRKAAGARRPSPGQGAGGKTYEVQA